jgi:hypothetical protein
MLFLWTWTATVLLPTGFWVAAVVTLAKLLK